MHRSAIHAPRQFMYAVQFMQPSGCNSFVKLRFTTHEWVLVCFSPLPLRSYLLSLTQQKNLPEGTPTIKQVLPPEKEKRGTDDLFVLLFTRLALQGIVCYTYKSVLSGGKYK